MLKQSTARNKLVLMVLSSDHVTGATGLTLTITASKDGAAFASITPTVTELATGWYSLALTTAHTDTLGDLALHITSTGADPTDVVWQVVLDLPGVAQTGDSFARIGAAGAGLTAADDAVITALGALNNLSSAQVASALATFAAAQPAETASAVGVAPTRDQLLVMAHALLATFAFTTTTQSVKKSDGTQMMAYGIDSVISPTSHTRTA